MIGMPGTCVGVCVCVCVWVCVWEGGAFKGSGVTNTGRGVLEAETNDCSPRTGGTTTTGERRATQSPPASRRSKPVRTWDIVMIYRFVFPEAFFCL